MTGLTPGINGGPPTWRRRARTVVVTGAVLSVIAVGALAALGLGGGDGPRAVRRSGPAATTKVTRQTLVQAVTMRGGLGYGATTPITSTASGTVTWLPEVGAKVRRGGALMRVDERPVVLLYGPLPMYRPLTAGVVGEDARQFEQNLRALGYYGFDVDNQFSKATTVAVQRWQKSLGIEPTGTVDRGGVIYAATSVRIAQRLVRVGASATGDVLSYTGSTKVVTVSTEPSKAAWAAHGTKVDLTPPGGKSTAGKVARVSDSAPADGGQGDAAPAGDTGDGKGGVVITIRFAHQGALGNKAGAPVSVRYIQQKHRNVLTVPVNALIALAEGGYGVEVVTSGGTKIAAVKVGLFADGRVEVSGDGLQDGASVGIPG